MSRSKRSREKRKAMKLLGEAKEFFHSPEVGDLMSTLGRDPLLFGCDMDDYNPEQRARLEAAQRAIAARKAK